MKIQLLLLVALTGSTCPSLAQTVKSDSVIMGPGYANQIFYKMSKGKAGSSPVNNWSIAHTSTEADNNIRANHMQGLQVIPYPKGDKTAWGSFDTAGWKSWTKVWNSIHRHNLGALMQTMDSSTMWDVGWGVYDASTQVVTGDSLYLLAWLNGAGQPTKFLKLMLIRQDAGNLHFRYADLDGNNDKMDTLFQDAADFQNYKYFNFLTNDSITREPNRADWDISFNRYYAPTWDGFTWQMYPVMGVESNMGVKVARVFGQTWSQLMASDTHNLVKNIKSKFTDSMTAIGSDWKFFDGMKFVIMDKQSYIVRSRDTLEYWLMNFTGFGGGASGKSVFNRVQLTNTSSVKFINGTSLQVFPNPVKDKLFISLDGIKTGTFNFEMMNANGQQMQQGKMNYGPGFSAASLDVSKTPQGIYFLRIADVTNSQTFRIIIQ